MNVVTLLACHSNSPIKVQAILHNLPFLFEISGTVVLINSAEFNGLLEPKITNPRVIVNDVLPDELCSAYKSVHADLSHMSNTQLRHHWKHHGKREKRTFGVAVRNLYFEYAPNDKFIAHGKWAASLQKMDCAQYDHFILTNDSFVVTRSLRAFQALMAPGVEMVALLDSNQGPHHYPDFLRAYNQTGLRKWLAFFEEQRPNITDFLSVIHVYEIGSSRLFEAVRVLFRSPQAPVNIHFDNAALVDYLMTKQYPVVKLKKILSNEYPNNDLPPDFNSGEYRMLNADLSSFSDEGARAHFVAHGASEGRPYKKNQKLQRLQFLDDYLKMAGFVV
jgi:hypothetical protein